MIGLVPFGKYGRRLDTSRFRLKEDEGTLVQQAVYTLGVITVTLIAVYLLLHSGVPVPPP